MKKVKSTQVIIGVSLCLSLCTAIATTIVNQWNARNIYNLFYFTFLSFSILSAIYVVISKRKEISERAQHLLRVGAITLYILIYLICTLTYVFTGQITKLQTIIFLSGLDNIIIIAGVFLILILLFGLLIRSISKRIKVKDKSRKPAAKMLVINLILLGITLIANTLFLSAENSLITDKNELIAYRSEQVLLPELSKINETFEQPNVVFILLESITAERLGMYGYPLNVSPNMDALSEKSIVFTNAYTTATHSEYALPGLVSSRYIVRGDFRNTFTDNNPRKFVWEVFKEKNYSTGYFSSQDDRWQNMNRYLNYDSLDSYSYSVSDEVTDYGIGFSQKDYDHRTRQLATQWLSQAKEPFFIYLDFQATHEPYVYPDGYEKFDHKYDNSLHYVDDQIGKIISYLQSTNKLNNTIIVITADHGHDLENRHDIAGHGLSIYNEELIVPALIFIPNVKPTVVHDPVSHIDFVPALLDLLGHPIPDEFQGDVLRKNRPIYFVTQSHKYKIGMVENNIKVIIDMHRNMIEVYDLERDPKELHKLSSKQYKKQILKLLFWHFCQKEYYKNKKWISFEQDRCSVHNNFKI